MYKWRGQPFSVYVLNSEHPRVGSVPRLVERLGQEEMIWSKGGRTYAVVARGQPVGDRARGSVRSAIGTNSVRRFKRLKRSEFSIMMTTRWMIAAAGALGVGVLTASAMLGPTQHVRGRAETDAADPAT